MTVNDVDITKVIESHWEMHQSPKDGKFTKTTQFLLPSIELKITSKVLKYFVNAFLTDVAYEHEYDNPLFLLFKYAKSKEWDETYKELKANKNYRVDYNAGSKDGWDLIMLVYEVPSTYKEDYLNFKKGKYSQFSIAYKEKFPRFITTNNKREEATIWKIIHKDKSLKEQLEKELNISPGVLDDDDELWDIPRKDTEFYNYVSVR